MTRQPAINRLRVGVVGAGAMGASHVGTLAAGVPVAQVTRVFDMDTTRAGDVASAVGGVASESAESLIADAEVDAIVIASPDFTHADLAIAAIEAGKHVLCEKPYTRRPAEVEEAFDAADAAGLHLMEAFMWRHNPQTQRLRGLLDEGAIGAVRLVRACFSFVLAADIDVRLDPALDGGGLMDVGCYCVSGARLVAGEPESVSAQAVNGPTGVDLRLSGLLRFPDDVLGVIDCGLDIYSRAELEVVGSEGRLLLADPWHANDPKIVLERGFEREIVAIDPADSYALELADMAAAIAGERPPLLGRDDALGQARTIEALYRSAEEGRAVTLA